MPLRARYVTIKLTCEGLYIHVEIDKLGDRRSASFPFLEVRRDLHCVVRASAASVREKQMISKHIAIFASFLVMKRCDILEIFACQDREIRYRCLPKSKR